jgi:hypothetical protein
MKLLLCFSVSVIATFSFAQSTSPQVISTSGNSFNIGSSQLDWTLGEPVTATLNAGSNLLTQGFHQPNLTVTSINQPQTGYTVNIFPNPSTDVINIEFKDRKGNLTVQLSSVDGKILESKKVDNLITLQLTMAQYKAGTYLLSIMDDQSKVRTYRVVKTN